MLTEANNSVTSTGSSVCPKGQGEPRGGAVCGGQGGNEGAGAELASERSHRTRERVSSARTQGGTFWTQRLRMCSHTRAVQGTVAKWVCEAPSAH